MSRNQSDNGGIILFVEQKFAAVGAAVARFALVSQLGNQVLFFETDIEFVARTVGFCAVGTLFFIIGNRNGGLAVRQQFVRLRRLDSQLLIIAVCLQFERIGQAIAQSFPRAAATGQCRRDGKNAENMALFVLFHGIILSYTVKTAIL
ncbi:hypothetical protein CGZ77_10825 [Neisseria sp. KEM232]|nr:hypothetical protein CGZ77_10825 [Neisseria sp. KEM232]